MATVKTPFLEYRTYRNLAVLSQLLIVPRFMGRCLGESDWEPVSAMLQCVKNCSILARCFSFDRTALHRRPRSVESPSREGRCGGRDLQWTGQGRAVGHCTTPCDHLGAKQEHKINLKKSARPTSSMKSWWQWRSLAHRKRTRSEPFKSSGNRRRALFSGTCAKAVPFCVYRKSLKREACI